MPDPKQIEEAKIAPEVREKILKWMSAHWPRPVCPICQHQRWNMAEHWVEITLLGITKEPDAPFIPMVSLSCERCGYSVMFNGAKIMEGESPSSFWSTSPTATAEVKNV